MSEMMTPENNAAEFELPEAAQAAVSDQQASAELQAQELINTSIVTLNDMMKSIDGMQAHLKGRNDKPAKRMREEADRMRRSLHAAIPGNIDLSTFLSPAPKADDLAFPGRAASLCIQARPRLSKSSFMFPDPASVIKAAGPIVGGMVTAEDMMELEIRLAHYFARMNIKRDGMVVSSAMRRILEAASIVALGDGASLQQRELLATVSAALLSFISEARRRGSKQR